MNISRKNLRAQSVQATSGRSYMEARGLPVTGSQTAALHTRSTSRVAPPGTTDVANVHDMSGIASPSTSFAASSVTSPPRYSASTLPARFRNQNSDRTFAFGAEPASEDRRRRPKQHQHRPRSALDHVDMPHVVYPEDDVDSTSRLDPGYKTHYRQQHRPFSMLDRCSMNDSFRSQLSSEYGSQHPHWTSQESMNTLTSNTYSEGPVRQRCSEAGARQYVREYGTARSSASIRTDSHRSHGNPADSVLLHHSMPRLNQDFGIFGDNDEDNMDDSVYRPSPGKKHVPQILVTPSRTKSQGDCLHREPCDVTQQQINMALAHSLAGDQAAGGGFPKKPPTPYVNPQTRIHPSARQANHPAPQHRPVRLKDNLWTLPASTADQSTADSTLNESTVTIDRFKVGRKKKDKQKKTDSVSLMDLSPSDGDKKKKSFSFKNIFFRKR